MPLVPLTGPVQVHGGLPQAGVGEGLQSPDPVIHVLLGAGRTSLSM